MLGVVGAAEHTRAAAGGHPAATTIGAAAGEAGRAARSPRLLGQAYQGRLSGLAAPWHCNTETLGCALKSGMAPSRWTHLSVCALCASPWLSSSAQAGAMTIQPTKRSMIMQFRDNLTARLQLLAQLHMKLPEDLNAAEQQLRDRDLPELGQQTQLLQKQIQVAAHASSPVIPC